MVVSMSALEVLRYSSSHKLAPRGYQATLIWQYVGREELSEKSETLNMINCGSLVARKFSVSFTMSKHYKCIQVEHNHFNLKGF